MVDNNKKRGLGRGLSALMADVADPVASGAQVEGASTHTVPIERVFANPDQPRRNFHPPDLKDLANSIRDKGVIQPLIVRHREGGTYEIVAGERRWRAAQMAQLHELPVVVRDFTDAEVLEVAIVENIQRADLNPIEEAAGYRQLMDKFGHTQEKLSEALGKSRSHIANLLRLLSLPEPVIEFLREGTLTAGHARALIPADDPVALARIVVKEGLSVRAVEALVKNQQKSAGSSVVDAKKSKKTVEKDADTLALEADLSAHLGMRVTLNHRPGEDGGQLLVSYQTLDQLDDLCRLLSGT